MKDVARIRRAEPLLVSTSITLFRIRREVLQKTQRTFRYCADATISRNTTGSNSNVFAGLSPHDSVCHRNLQLIAEACPTRRTPRTVGCSTPPSARAAPRLGPDRY